MKYGFVIDNRKCIGCHACTVACKAEHDVPIGVNRTWIKQVEKGDFPETRRVFSVMRCNHCSDAPCVSICPVEALHTREDGIIDFDNQRCIGCKACTQACPYDALYIDPNTNTAAKCNYCAHRIDIGLEPACVNVCPEHAIISGDMDDPGTEISQLLGRHQVTVRKPEKGTAPNLFYINGDESSLSPGITEKSTQYLWNSQDKGVGHFAKYAEKRIEEADVIKMAKELAGKTGVNEGEIRKKSIDVIMENSRRVYDSPHKGILWGWEVSAYVWTKAIAAGAFLVIFLATITNAAVVSEYAQWGGLAAALLGLGLTGALLVKDLDQPTRFVYVLLRPQWKSWLVRGGYSITVYGAMLTLWGVAKFFGWPAIQNIALWIAAAFAVLTAVYTAFLFAQAKGRDFWQSPTLAIHMLVHSIMAGAASFALAGGLFGGGADWMSFLRLLLIAGISANLVVLLVEIVTPHPTQDAKMTVKMIISGRYRILFWVGAVLIGNILPLLFAIEGSTFLMVLSGALTLLGIYFTEKIWVEAPQRISLS